MLKFERRNKVYGYQESYGYEDASKGHTDRIIIDRLRRGTKRLIYSNGRVLRVTQAQKRLYDVIQTTLHDEQIDAIDMKLVKLVCKNPKTLEIMIELKIFGVTDDDRLYIK